MICWKIFEFLKSHYIRLLLGGYLDFLCFLINWCFCLSVVEEYRSHKYLTGGSSANRRYEKRKAQIRVSFTQSYSGNPTNEYLSRLKFDLFISKLTSWIFASLFDVFPNHHNENKRKLTNLYSLALPHLRCFFFKETLCSGSTLNWSFVIQRFLSFSQMWWNLISKST